MKSKRRHQSSSEESEQSDGSEKSSSSSDSESEDSSASEHRYKKKRKRADSSESDSDTDGQKRSKKRKHKKKKKKHGKKKRRSNPEDMGGSDDEVSSVSEGEISSKKKRKHKHKHSKRPRSSSGSVVIEETRVERRLHSVVKERRASSEEGGQPSRTYYQKEYHPSVSREDYERERELQRFHRGSSKDRRLQYEKQYQYNRERNERYASSPQEKYDMNREKYGTSSHFTHTNDDFNNRRQQQFDGFKRQQRYEGRGQEQYQKRTREDNFQARDDPRGYSRYNQYEDRAPKHQDYDDGRDFRERRGGPPETERYRQREYPDKREKYREEGYPPERPREPAERRERAAPRPPPPQDPEGSPSRSSQPRYRDTGKPDVREGRDERSRERERDSSQRSRGAERPRSEQEAKPKERKSRFADAEDKGEYSWGKTDAKKEDGKSAGEKEKPNFGLSGKLTADQNTVNGVVIKYSEPDDAKQPKRRWRFYPFKGDKALPILYIHRQSAFLLGRDKKVCDITLEHPSVSKQHAALQYRATPFTRPDGSQGRRVRPYIIDLESANGTFVNNKRVEPRRYVELLERDVVKFGFSLREYVLLHENSKDDAQDDDHHDPAEPAVTTTDKIKQEKRVKQETAEDGE